MLRTRLQFGRIRGEDQFYVPVKARKNQSKLQSQMSEGSKGNWYVSSNSSTNKKTSALDNGEFQEETISIDNPCREPPVVSHSNFDRFLESTTPSVQAQYLFKKTMRGLSTCNVEFQPHFTLSDLWDSFEEWSAYGAGVPLLLNGRDSIVQYYVPYLSGIQLYGPTKDSNSKLRLGGEESDSDYLRDSNSEGSSDYETEKGVNFSRSVKNSPSGSSTSDEKSSGQEGFSSDDGEEGIGNSRGSLLFEFLERDPPHIREPLADKVTDLARRFPALKTLSSCDLLPTSWISVAWYPIYQIPTGPTLKDLDACFLTYHSLSMPTAGGGAQSPPVMVYHPSNYTDINVPKIQLPVFGMATYKMKGSSMWTHNGGGGGGGGVSDRRQMASSSSLLHAADNWLRLVGVHHPDFHFFSR